MKRIFILSLLLIVCTGCIRIDKEENKNIIVDDIIVAKSNPNTMAMGYKYYLPLGVSKIYDKDFNQKFKYNDSYIYLYVDVVSYYYRNDLNFSEEDENSYFYRKITNGKKSGYVKITQKENDLYYIKIIYNYAKIEAYVKEDEINGILTNGLIILSSIDYNDNLIKKRLEDDYNIGTEKEYKINKPEDAKSKFSEYLSEYVEGENKQEDLPEY